MEHFWRVMGYVKPQCKTVAVSVLCAMLGAGLYSLSVVAMQPLMKVLIAEESLDAWVHRSIFKSRAGVKLFPLSPISSRQTLDDNSEANDSAGDNSGTNTSDSGGRVIAYDHLEIMSITRRGMKKNEGLLERDKIVCVMTPTSQLSGTEEILAYLAKTDAKEVTITVSRGSDDILDMRMRLDDKPLYAKLAEWVLGKLPKSRGVDFKRNSLVMIIGVMLLATILKCFLRFVQQYLAKRVAIRSVTNLRLTAYESAIRLPLSFFSNEGTSDTTSRFLQDSRRTMVGITTLLGKMVREPFVMLFMACWALWIDSKMTLIVMMGAPVAGLVINKLGKKIKKATKRALEGWSALLSRLQESLQGIRVVKGYHQEYHEQESFLKVSNRLLKQQLRIAKIEAGSGPLLEALGMIAASVGMVFAAHAMTRSENPMATSDFVVLVGLLAAMAESGRKLGDVWPKLQTANAAAERMYELIDQPREQNAGNALELGQLAKSLEFRNVTFTYDNSTVPAIRNFSLKVQVGNTIAVVGPNGSGKTTLLSLIPRFFVPDSGEILIDGHNIDTVTLASLRGQIGIVTQQTVVFNNTIAANIAYGKQDASIEEIIVAAKHAYADEFITATDNGYETIIGEQGARLSGGQLQRLAIARAILRDPAILIFDEATSQIDSESEAKIQKAIAEFSHDRTSFIIAHRLSTIVSSDRIVVLNDGQLVAVGTHTELFNTCDLYKQLYETQFA